MIVHRFATLLHNVESFRLAVSGEVLVDAGAAGLGRDRRVIRHGGFLPMLLHFRQVASRRAVQLVAQTDPVHARIALQSVCFVAGVVAARLSRFEFGVVVVVVGIAEPLVVISDMLRRTRRLLLRIELVVGIPIIIVTLASCIERINLIQDGLRGGRLLPLLHLLQPFSSLIDSQLILQALLLRYFLHDR